MKHSLRIRELNSCHACFGDVEFRNRFRMHKSSKISLTEKLERDLFKGTDRRKLVRLHFVDIGPQIPNKIQSRYPGQDWKVCPMIWGPGHNYLCLGFQNLMFRRRKIHIIIMWIMWILLAFCICVHVVSNVKASSLNATNILLLPVGIAQIWSRTQKG